MNQDTSPQPGPLPAAGLPAAGLPAAGLPARVPAADGVASVVPDEPGPRRTRCAWRTLGRDTTYVLLSLPVAIASFSLLITGLCLALGLLVTVVGIPVAAWTLAVAIGFGRLERRRLAARGTALAPVQYAPTHGTGLRRMLGVLSDPRRWAAFLHGIGAFVLAIVTWTVTVTWWSTALGSLTYWFWGRWLPDSADDNVFVVGDRPLTQILREDLGWHVSTNALYLVVGLVFAASLPWVVRWCAELHAAWARLLLTGASRRALAAQVEDLTTRRSAAASAEAQSLRKLERDIHDGPQQRLVRLGMDLSIAERRLEDDPAAARDLLAAARVQASETLAELRALSRGIAPPVLTDRGLTAALTAVAARSSVPTSIDVDLPRDERPASTVESAAYFVACEALTNTAKHAGATSAAVRVRRVGVEGTSGAWLRVEVQDDGIGGAAVSKGQGLAGLTDRVEGLGGTLVVTSPDGGPTTVRADLPWV